MTWLWILAFWIVAVSVSTYVYRDDLKPYLYHLNNRINGGGRHRKEMT